MSDVERIIGSVREVERRPILSAILSFFFTGLGQWYCGEALRAVVFLLLRLLPIFCLPFISFSAQGARLMYSAALMVLASLIVWLGAFIDAYFLARRRPILLGRITRPWAYILYAFLAFACTAGAVIPAAASYGIHVQRDDSMLPLFRRGDVLLINRLSADPPKPGSVIVCREGDRERAVRAAARPGDRAAGSGSMLAVKGEFLLLGIYNDSEIRSLGLENSTELFYELNDGKKYPVRADSGSGKPAKYKGPSMEAGPGRIFVADDNRIDRGWLAELALESITGRVEGIIWGGSLNRSFVGPFLDISKRAFDMNRVNILD